MTDAIISIRPQHVENIINGSKTVELRTKNINLPVGSRLWIYTTLPVGKVETSAEIQFIETLTPDEIWDKFGPQICISEKEFTSYTKNHAYVTVIGLTKIKSLCKSLCLNTLRGYEKGFNPPQFFSKLHPDRDLYSAFYS